MKHMLRTAILIVAAMVSSALILAGLFEVVRNVNLYGKGVADFVVKEEIQALLFHPTQKAIEEFPFLKDTYTDADAVAIFANFETAFFQKNVIGTGAIVGPYLIETSDTNVLSFVKQQEEPLSADATFTALKKHKGTNQWTYLPSSSLPSSTTILSRILRAMLMARSDAIAVLYTEDDITVQHPDTQSSISAPTSIPDMPGAFLELRFGNAQASFLTLLENLSAQDAVVFEALLSSTLSYFGEGISFRYDLLPLLEKPSSMQISTSGETVNVLLSGSSNDALQLQSILDRLHTTYERSLPTSTITKRILDKRFSSIDMRHNANSIEQNQYTKDGWLIRSTQLKGSTTGLATATRQNFFLITTTRAAIAHAMENQKSAAVRSTAQMTFDLSKLPLLLTDMANTQKDITNTFGTGTLNIISHHDGKIRSITIGSSRIPLQLLDLLR
jgi:hypothetical protein